MSTRMSFAETPNYKEALGFLIRISPIYDAISHSFIIQRGSLIYGFRDAQQQNSSYGFLFDNDITIPLPLNNQIINIGMTRAGILRTLASNNSNNLEASIRGLGANFPGIPWYSVIINEEPHALIAKVFMDTTAVVTTGFIVCDDVFWCEFLGEF